MDPMSSDGRRAPRRTATGGRYFGNRENNLTQVVRGASCLVRVVPSQDGHARRMAVHDVQQRFDLENKIATKWWHVQIKVRTKSGPHAIAADCRSRSRG